MEAYLLVNIFILALALLALRIIHIRKSMMITFAVIFVMTVIGDSIIIGLGIVSYDPHKILGLSIGLAPIEDFFYPLAAAIIIPTVWDRLAKDA